VVSFQKNLTNAPIKSTLEMGGSEGEVGCVLPL